MNILIKSATIINPSSAYHNCTKDILIENGIISKIDTSINNTNNYDVIEKENLHVSLGWFDSSVCFGEPGFEDRETINNGLFVAGKSGFTSVAMQPKTNPVANNNSHIFSIKAKSQGNAVELLPIGALTMEGNGVDLAELYDMQQAGAVAFNDYKSPVKNPNLLKLALQYTKDFNAVVCSYPSDTNIAGSGVMNEEFTSTSIGLKGIPNLAENLQVARDLFLLEYTGGKLHIPTISTAESVQLIADAKAKRLNVTCSVAIHNLILDETELTAFNTQYKVFPPLRTKEDIKALIEGVKNGTIDFVTTDHNPITIEDKKVEFNIAKYGSIGLETAFGALNTLFGTEKTVELLTNGKNLFSAKQTSFNEGEEANLSLFNPNNEFTVTKDDLLSKSKNSIFIGHKIKGKAYGIIANKQTVL